MPVKTNINKTMNEIVKKNGVNFGVIMGVISIIATTIMYALDITLFVNIWVGITLFLINIVIGIVAVAKAKKGFLGFISFKDAFTVFFITMAIGSLMGALYMLVLFNFIDPAAKATITESAIEMTVKFMQQAGSKTADIAKTVKDMRETDNFAPLSMIKSYFGGLLMYTIIGLIVAAAMKKNNEVFN